MKITHFQVILYCMSAHRGRATAHREPLVDGKLEDQLMSVSGKLRHGMRWLVKVRKGP
ncbi:MAG: hypothetical protein ACI90E_002083, partial [Yoonia sp.]